VWWLAAYFGIAPTLVRIIAVLLALPGGGPPIGVIYLVLWVVVSEEPVGT
jgi:phage shock protein PspC (stress-responsive transcriptional regulator)